MQFGHLRRALPGVVALVGLAVAGCTSSGSPTDPSSPLPTFSAPSVSIESSPSAPVSESPSFATSGPNVRPGEKPPQMLPGTEENNAVGATQFAMFWIQTLDWGYATTDSTLTKTYDAPSCKECKRFTDIIDSAKRAGHHFRGGRIVASKWVIADNDHRDGAAEAIDVTLSQGSVQEVSATGKPVGSPSPAIKNQVRRVWLKWQSGGWTVVDTREVVHR